MQGIYCILNKINNKRYIGSSKNINRRLNYHHIYKLDKQPHWNCYLQSAWNLYKKDGFDFLILEEVQNEVDLLDREQYWMDHYNSYNRDFGYNLAPKADRTIVSEETKEKMRNRLKGSRLLPEGYKHSEETKLKIAEAGKKRKGMKFSQKHKENIGKARRGITYEQKYGLEKALSIKQKISNASKGHQYCLGKTASDETKKKMSETRKCHIPEEIVNEIIKLYCETKKPIIKHIAFSVSLTVWKVNRVLKDKGLLSIDETKSELAKRPHIPNKKEVKESRAKNSK